MAIITQRGTVDLIPEYNRALRPIFCVSEGDANSRVINLSVTSGGEAFTIPSGAMVYVAGKKQDNNIFTYGCSFTSNTVVFPITAQMSADDGIVLCELQVIVNGDPLGSANFVYWVEPSPIQNGTTSESDLNLFEEAISKFENFDHFYADVEAMVTEAVANMQIREGQTVIDASLTVEGAAADAKATGDIVRAFMNALITETTEESTIATCDDAAGGLPLKTLTANIAPAQAGSGDPSPDNVRPISGYTGVTVTRTGKNIVEVPTGTYRGLVITRNDDGTFNINGTTTNSVDISIFSYNSNMSLCPFRGNYKISINGDFTVTGNGGLYASDLSVTRIMSYRTSGTYTTANGIGRMWMYFPNAATVSGDHVQIMAYSADEDDTFAPYTGATYAVNFPSEAGTVYGGTLNVYSDGSGTLTVDRNMVTLNGTETWTNVSANPDIFACNSAAPNCDTSKVWDTAHSGSLQLTTNETSTTYYNNNSLRNNAPCTALRNIGTVVLSIGADYTTVEQCKAWLAEHPLQVAYYITPTTYALSAVQVATMLNGVNNIWTDTAGTLTTEYYASTGLYVEKKVNAQRNMIAGVEEAMIATKNYSVNDLLIVGNTLYKATAAISSGAALVVGTNVTETTVAEQLLALA